MRPLSFKIDEAKPYSDVYRPHIADALTFRTRQNGDVARPVGAFIRPVAIGSASNVDFSEYFVMAKYHADMARRRNDATSGRYVMSISAEPLFMVTGMDGVGTATFIRQQYIFYIFMPE